MYIADDDLAGMVAHIIENTSIFYEYSAEECREASETYGMHVLHLREYHYGGVHQLGIGVVLFGENMDILNIIITYDNVCMVNFSFDAYDSSTYYNMQRFNDSSDWQELLEEWYGRV